MAITVGLYGGEERRHQQIREQVSARPGLFVKRMSERIADLQAEHSPPLVVVLGVPAIARHASDDPFYGLLLWLQTEWPDVRVAVCADSLEPGAALDLTRAGVLGIVLWADARPDLWPLLVRAVYAHTAIWSRPFDVRPIRVAARAIAVSRPEQPRLRR